MNVTFVGIGTEQLGVSQLSAIAKKEGHRVGLAFSASLFHDRFNLEYPSLSPYFDDTHEVIQAIRDQQPDVLAFSALTSTYQWMLDIARQAKEINPNIKTVFGGVHASAVPDLVIQRPQVDYVVSGEGDFVFPEILQAIQTGSLSGPIANTRYKTTAGQVVTGIQKGFIQDLDSLPFYDKILWEEVVRIGDLYLTMATRGCPYRCTFCFNNFFAKLPEEKSGKYVRMRSVDHVIAELKWAKNRYHLRKIDFQDDVFATSKKWLEEFAYKYKKEINIPYIILTHPRYVDEETIRYLKESGCEWIQMGVQSMDESFKRDNLMRYERAEDVYQALDLMHRYRINVKVDHMFGLPDEPVQAQEDARLLYAKTQPGRIQTYWTSFLPGTEMMKEAMQRGTLTDEQARKINEGEDFLFFRNTENVQDPALMRRYMVYEFIFKVMPVLPAFLKAAITPARVQFIPVFLLHPLSVLSDILSGIRQRNPEFYAYARHNVYHLKRFFLRKYGWKVSPASVIRTPQN